MTRKNLFDFLNTGRAHTRKAPARRRVTLQVEALETRDMPAVLTVNVLSDDASDTTHLTLREAVAAVNAQSLSGLTAAERAEVLGTLGGNDTIRFDAALVSGGDGTITLTSAGDTGDFGRSALKLGRSVSIIGPGGDNGITITQNLTGADAMRLFFVASGATVTIQNLTLSGGIAQGIDGDDGDALFEDDQFYDQGGSGGGLGAGGAIFNRGTLNIIGSTLNGNQAFGGNGGDGASDYGGTGPGSGAPALGDGSTFGGGATFGAGGTATGLNSLVGYGGSFGGGGGGFGYGGGATGTPGKGGFGAGDSGGGGNSPGGGGGAGLGGAIFNAGGVLNLTNSTLAHNQAQGGKGGTSLYSTPYDGLGGSGFGAAVFNLNGTVGLTNATLAFNTVVAGTGSTNGGAAGTFYNLAYGKLPGDLPVKASATLINSILTDLVNKQDTTQNAGDVAAITAVMNASNSTNILSTAATNIGGTINGSFLVVADLGLADADLMDHGGPTKTIAIKNTGAAFDAGSDAVVPSPYNLLLDQRGNGFPRLRSAHVDIGAFEVQEGSFLPTLIAFEDVNLKVTDVSVGAGLTDPVTVTLTVLDGTLKAPKTAGVSVTGNRTAAVTLTGSSAAVNAALAKLIYRGGRNFGGVDLLQITSSDGSVTVQARVAIDVKSAAEQAADLREQVAALHDTATLNSSQAGVLISLLTLQRDRWDTARVRLFLAAAKAFRHIGVLSASQADALLGPGGILLLSVSRH